MDAVDKAQQLEQAQRDKALASAKSAPKTKGRLTCEDCGIEIPLARRLANPSATRCIECQQRFERENR